MGHANGSAHGHGRAASLPPSTGGHLKRRLRKWLVRSVQDHCCYCIFYNCLRAWSGWRPPTTKHQRPGSSSGDSAASNARWKLQELLAIQHGALKEKVDQVRRCDKRDDEVLDVFGDRSVPSWTFDQTVFHSRI